MTATPNTWAPDGFARLRRCRRADSFAPKREAFPPADGRGPSDGAAPHPARHLFDLGDPIR